MKYIRKNADAYKVEIFIGGPLDVITKICQEYCNDLGLCVTVEPVNYVFTSGSEMGVRIGLINYARFPKKESIIWTTAVELALDIRTKLGEGSFTVQDYEHSDFYSTRKVDLDD